MSAAQENTVSPSRAFAAVLVGVLGSASAHAVAWRWPLLPARAAEQAVAQADQDAPASACVRVVMAAEVVPHAAAIAEEAAEAEAARDAAASAAPSEVRAAEVADVAVPASVAPTADSPARALELPDVPECAHAVASDSVTAEVAACPDVEAGAKLAVAENPVTDAAMPTLVLVWPDLAAIAAAVARHGFVLAGVRGDRIVCAIDLLPEPSIRPWSIPLSRFSARARELPLPLFARTAQAGRLDGVWLMVPVAVEREFERALRAAVVARGLTLERTGAVYGRVANDEDGVLLRVERVVTRPQ